MAITKAKVIAFFTCGCVPASKAENTKKSTLTTDYNTLFRKVANSHHQPASSQPVKSHYNNVDFFNLANP